MGARKKAAKKRAGSITSFRLDAEVIDALDRHVARLNAAEPGRRATRSDALRALVLRSTIEIEKGAAS